MGHADDRGRSRRVCMFNVQQPLSCMWHHANSCRMTRSAHVSQGRALLRVWGVRMVKAFAARLRRIADRLDPPAAPEPRPWIVVTGPTTNTGSLAGTTWRINTTN